MRVLTTTQGTPEWDAARKGRITASRICDAIRGPGAKSRAALILDLVFDWEGVPNFTDEETPPWFLYGRKYEEWARGWYRWHYKADVIETGFVVHDEIDWLGCSPDGLLNHDGLLEIKCHESRLLMRKAAEKPAQAVVDQVQAQLFVTGRNFCDLLHFWRDDQHDLEDGIVVRIGRDEHRIAYIVSKSIQCYRDALKLKRLRGRNGGMLASSV